ncbi:MAG: DMT family transporter [Candidatus Magasanikbacteria bacterium]|nr:DMT family transporter [Candidatus Magasanikbacteria bacterium]
MLWFFIAILGYALLALVFVLDKFILSKSLGSPALYAFYSSIFMFGALFVLPFGVQALSSLDWFWALVSGLSFGCGLWAMFTALKRGEASHIAPFIGAMVTIAVYGMSHVFLSESLSPLQLLGILILIFASLLLSFEKTKKQSGFHIGFVWAIIAGFLFGLSHVTAKYLYEIYPFLTAFVWTRASTGFLGILLLFFPSVYKEFKKMFSKKKEKLSPARNSSFGKDHVFVIVGIDKLLGIIAIVLIQYAISIGSVTLVNALSGLQYVLMFLMIYIMTKWAPRLFKEYFTEKELRIEVFALVLVLVGSALFVIS